MEKRPFGPAGIPVSAIGQGTWNMERDDRRLAVAAIRRGLDLGLTHVDTAEMYGDGAVEELVGEAIAGRRDEVFLVTKVLPFGASRSGTLRACERSLRRLGTDVLDCYLLHWESEHPLEETFAAFEELRERGSILSWGVSNFHEGLLARALEVAGEGRIACDQVLYHLKERSIEHAVLPACEERSIALVGYSPFGSRDFPSERSASGDVLAGIAGARGATPRQVALAYLLRRGSTFVIPKSSDPGHVAENAAAAGLALEPDEIRRLEEAFPLSRHRPGWVPVL